MQHQILLGLNELTDKIIISFKRINNWPRREFFWTGTKLMISKANAFSCTWSHSGGSSNCRRSNACTSLRERSHRTDAFHVGISGGCCRQRWLLPQQLTNTGWYLTFFPGNKQHFIDKAKCSLVPGASVVTEALHCVWWAYGITQINSLINIPSVKSARTSLQRLLVTVALNKCQTESTRFFEGHDWLWNYWLSHCQERFNKARWLFWLLWGKAASGKRKNAGWTLSSTAVFKQGQGNTAQL